jgi:hypothetical protein
MKSELPIADFQLPNENQGSQRNQKQYEPPRGTAEQSAIANRKSAIEHLVTCH